MTQVLQHMKLQSLQDPNLQTYSLSFSICQILQYLQQYKFLRYYVHNSYRQKNSFLKYNNLNNSNYRYVNGYNNYNYSFKQVNTNPTNFYSSNNSHTYINTTTIILPPKTYYSNKTSYPMKMNNYYNNNMNYTNFNKTSYQPSYINGTYSNNANNIIPRTSYNTIKGHKRYLTDNNILELITLSLPNIILKFDINSSFV